MPFADHFHFYQAQLDSDMRRYLSEQEFNMYHGNYYALSIRLTAAVDLPPALINVIINYANPHQQMACVDAKISVRTNLSAEAGASMWQQVEAKSSVLTTQHNAETLSVLALFT